MVHIDRALQQINLGDFKIIRLVKLNQNHSKDQIHQEKRSLEDQHQKIPNAGNIRRVYQIIHDSAPPFLGTDLKTQHKR